MGSEIERKFLLNEEPSWLHNCPAVRIEQGYLAITEDVEVRLRQQESRTLLTVKCGHGEVREEVEIALEKHGFKDLWPLTKSRRIAKTRRFVQLEGGLCAEVDVYAGKLDGLLVAEVEFDSEQQGREFRPPPWMQREITGDNRYANQSLALHGLPEKWGRKNQEPPEHAVK
jgi:adenylate cyclase